MGRGGSDYSAALLGVALSAEEVWIWTDVNGVMTADPRLVENAKTIPEISYQEVSELAFFGAKVLHPKTIRPVIEAEIILRVLNTFDPENPGTRLTTNQEQSDQDESIIKSVNSDRGVQLVTVEGSGMLGVPGQAARFLSAVSKTGATVPFITELLLNNPSLLRFLWIIRLVLWKCWKRLCQNKFIPELLIKSKQRMKL